jgi:hypothetical protein
VSGIDRRGRNMMRAQRDLGVRRIVIGSDRKRDAGRCLLRAAVRGSKSESEDQTKNDGG